MTKIVSMDFQSYYIHRVAFEILHFYLIFRIPVLAFISDRPIYSPGSLSDGSDKSILCINVYLSSTKYKVKDIFRNAFNYCQTAKKCGRRHFPSNYFNGQNDCVNLN